MNQLDEEVLPAPIIETGVDRPGFEVYDGDVWEVPDGGEVYAGFMKDVMRNL